MQPEKEAAMPEKESVGKHFGNMTNEEISALLVPLFDSLPQYGREELVSIEEAFG